MAGHLNAGNIASYVRQTYGEIKDQKIRRVSGIIPYLQNEYEGDGDCTLVSIMTCCRFFNKSFDDKTYYAYIKKIAKKFLYTDTIGTQAPFINAIIKRVFKNFGIAWKSKSAYFKNVG